MPLDAKNKGVFRAFDPFDEPIGRGCVDDQTFAWIADSLMMGCVDLDCSAVKDSVQQRALRQLDGVSIGMISLML